MILPVLCLHFCFLTEKITKGTKTLVSSLEHIFMSLQHWKWCEKEATYFDVFYTQYIETSSPTLEEKCCLIRNRIYIVYSPEWNAVKKVCKLVRLEYMQIFPDTRTLNLYLTPCSAAILPPWLFWAYVFVICATKTNKKAYTLWDKCDLG